MWFGLTDRWCSSVKGDVRKLYEEDIHCLYSSPGIIRMMKARTLRWVEHVALMGKRRCTYRISVGK